MYLQLAWRNIWRNPRRTLIILSAIIIGVVSMIFLASLMRGMMEGMVENAIDNMVGHVRVRHPDYRTDPAIDNRMTEPAAIRREMERLLPGGTRIAERIRVDAVVNTAREMAGVTLLGISPEAEKGVSFIGNAPLEGRFFREGEAAGIVIGRSLADKLGTGIGRKVVLMSQDAEGEIASRAFRIRGIYRAELAATEKAFVFAPLSAVGRMLKVEGAATEIAAALPGRKIAGTDLSPLAKALGERLAPLGVRAEQWREALPAINAYLGLFDSFLYIWYLVVFAAMGFGIVNTVLMAVYERMREFGLLKALGMRPARIFRMVLGETLLLLAVGLLAGNLAGLSAVGLLSRTGINLSAFSSGTEMWGLDRIILPVLAPADLLTANLTVLVLGIAVGIYPALRAARFTPQETMRRS